MPIQEARSHGNHKMVTVLPGQSPFVSQMAHGQRVHLAVSYTGARVHTHRYVMCTTSKKEALFGFKCSIKSE